MRIRLGKKLFEFSDIQLDKMYIDEGMEGTIYRLGEDALKIYSKYPAKDRLNEEEALRLSKIGTERFLLPKKLIYDEDNTFIGYSTKFIEDYDFKNVRYLSMNELCSELDILYNELKSLNDNLVDVEDYSLYNAIYNGEIYIVDPGSYRFVKDEGYLHKDNKYKLNEFIIWYLLPYITDLSRPKKKQFRKNVDITEDIVDFMRYESLDNESVNDFVKRITR